MPTFWEFFFVVSGVVGFIFVMAFLMIYYDRYQEDEEMDNETAMDYRTMSDEEWEEICEEIKKINERRVAKQDDEQPPF